MPSEGEREENMPEEMQMAWRLDTRGLTAAERPWAEHHPGNVCRDCIEASINAYLYALPKRDPAVLVGLLEAALPLLDCRRGETDDLDAQIREVLSERGRNR